MTPQGRSILVGGAALIVAMVGLYLSLAIAGRGESTNADGSLEAAASSGEDNDRSIDLGDADADVAARSAEETANGGIDPAGPSVSSVSSTVVATTTTVRSPPTPKPSQATTSSVAPVTEPTTTTSTVASTAPTSSATDPVATAPATTASSTTAPPTTASSSTEPGPVSTAPSTTEPTTATQPPVAGLDAVEQEILRLTNELRVNPAGPLAREKPMPSCVTDPFYGIAIDGATGHPAATPALSVDVRVSSEMSRPWAVDMDSRNNLQHRASGSQLEIYERLGIPIAAIGENIAWFSGYPDEQAARVHFEGWRESDTGHYCAMVSGTYANMGVGHFKGATRSWAVQNFYSTR